MNELISMKVSVIKMNTVSSILSHAATFVELDERGCFWPTVSNGAVQTGYNPDTTN